MEHFRSQTFGHTLIMGRKTFEGVGLLMCRRTIVLSRDPFLGGKMRDHLDSDHWPIAAPSLKAALTIAHEPGPWDRRDVFICGGEQVYRQAIQQGVVNRYDITMIDAEPDGDAFFPWDAFVDAPRPIPCSGNP